MYPKVAPGKTGEEAVDTWRLWGSAGGQAMHMEIGSQGRPADAHQSLLLPFRKSAIGSPHTSCFVTAVIDG